MSIGPWTPDRERLLALLYRYPTLSRTDFGELERLFGSLSGADLAELADHPAFEPVSERLQLRETRRANLILAVLAVGLLLCATMLVVTM